MKFKICWWNTGLSPTRGQVDDPEHLTAVIEKLQMLSDDGVDLFCLGEVSEPALDGIVSRQTLSHIEFQKCTVDPVGTKFHMAIGCRTGRSEVRDLRYIVQRVRDLKSKVSIKFDLLIEDGSTFKMFVVHWPSRIYKPEDSNLRPILGALLRTQVDDLFEIEKNEKIILIGDFNDEPFNESIAASLSGSRDVDMVRRNRRLLYNPFWRMISPSGHYKVRGKLPKVRGSYYYSSGQIERWHVLDQALVSASFLGGADWHLDEENTMIWSDAAEFGVGPKQSKTIDHLPIIASFEKDTA